MAKSSDKEIDWSHERPAESDNVLPNIQKKLIASQEMRSMTDSREEHDVIAGIECVPSMKTFTE